MPNQTIMIIAAIVVIWIVLFAIFMVFNKKRTNKANSFMQNNSDKALVSLFCRGIKIDGSDISSFSHTKGEWMETVVSLDSGLHSFEGIFETTDTAWGKNINLKSERIKFDLNVESGHKYSVGMYLNSSKESGGETNSGEDILTIPLTLSQGSKKIKANIIAYREN